MPIVVLFDNQVASRYSNIIIAIISHKKPCRPTILMIIFKANISIIRRELSAEETTSRWSSGASKRKKVTRWPRTILLCKSGDTTLLHQEKIFSWRHSSR